MNFKNKKYKAVFNPLGLTSTGQYTIKTDDEIELPLAVVLLPIGNKKAKELALIKATHIVECLNSYEVCFHECTSCENDFDIEVMAQDSDSNWFCPECWEVLEPAMKSEYESMIASGEIEDPNNVDHAN